MEEDSMKDEKTTNGDLPDRASGRSGESRDPSPAPDAAEKATRHAWQGIERVDPATGKRDPETE
jgi:hypothetical protein